AEEIRRVRLRLCAHCSQGAGIAVGRRRAVRRILRLPGKPRALALHRRDPCREAADAGDVSQWHRLSTVMPGLVPGIHAQLAERKTWMAGTLARLRASSTRYARP